ncbi:sensor histidine kinase [Spirosoma spitsbergense]|uniref:sensor histidine kinase n=1 Tax=Spirosoma spitsbergense TaxID=431554 RepID=UPI00036097AD|nr:histidine kinase [Spirosoma spitsbergense]
MTNRLPARQKWLLSLQLLLLYMPVALYINVPVAARTGKDFVYFLPLLIVFIVLAFFVYFVWISAIDLIQQRLTEWFGDDFLLEFNLLALVLTILVSIGLSALYIVTFREITQGIAILYLRIWPEIRPENLAPAISPEALIFAQRVGYAFAVVIMLTAFYITNNARSYQQLKDVQLRAERLEKGAVVSQFEALKNQISPHFLFNSLSILTSLVHEDPNLSETFIKQLSKAYRYILEQRDQELVPLAIELDFIKAYTFLLKIRFEKKFDVTIDVPQDIQTQCRIAPLSLQMLVENTVKHNRMSLREPLLVRIYTNNGFLIVENPMQARDQPEFSTGIGLKNITDRYSLLTDQAVEFGERAGSFIVKIPLLMSERTKE